MGSNNTFFFQPGIESRTHPLTPRENYTLTEEIATFHAAALDKIGSLYYSKEDYDDFYYGKGSTYPDVQGAIGILFEQASARGHARQTPNGLLTFPFAIRNQFTTSLSTLRAATSLRTKLLDYQRKFHADAVKEAKAQSKKAIVFGSKHDRIKPFLLADLISRHDIKIYHLGKDVKIDGKDFQEDKSFMVPLDQPQYKLIKAMFESRQTFQDSLFYDVSAWTLPLAFGLEYQEVSAKSFKSSYLGDAFDGSLPKGKLVGKASGYAYAFNWYDYTSPKVLYQLLKRGLTVKAAQEPFIDKNNQQFDYGAILIPVEGQKMPPNELQVLLEQLAEQNSIDIFSLSEGATSTGPALGSRNFRVLKKPKVLLMTGSGVSASDAGEVWHLFDQRMDMPITRVDLGDVKSIDLDAYNVLVMTNGSYGRFSDQYVQKIKKWVKSGGTFITTRRGSKWIADKGISNFEFKKIPRDTLSKRSYADRKKYNGAQVIGGAIFSAKIDTSHPLGYGFERDEIPVFRNTKLFMEMGKNAYNTPLVYTADPLLSGYISKKNLDLLGGTAAINVMGSGKGKIISFTDNPNFRAFWLGTNKLFLNAIFFGSIIDTSSD